MQQITSITDAPNQQMTISLQDGTKLSMSFGYSKENYGWYFTNLNWNNGVWVECGRRIVNSGNMLRQYKNILTFGLACFTAGNREPTQIEDFSSGASSLYVLTPAEVLAFESYLQGLKNAQT